MSEDDGLKAMGQVIQIDDARIRDHLGEMVRGTVEETLNALLDAEADRLCGAGRPRDPDLLWLPGYSLAEDPNQQSTGADHERDPAQNPRRRCFPRRSVLPQLGGCATKVHRRHNMVGQMLHEHATTLSAAPI